MADLSATVAAQKAAAMAAYNRAVQAANVSNATARTVALAGGSAGNNPQGVLSQQQQAVNGLSYQPLDVEAIKKQATDQAAQNAARSIQLEQQLSPGVSSARQGLQKQVSDELAQQGNLPADVQARIGRTSAAQAGASGVLGSQAPATAAALGLTSLDLANSRRQNAANLLAANPLPVAGLDPGALASLGVANNQQANQFALSKAGAQGNVANSQLGFYGAQQAQEQANNSIAAASNPMTTISAAPYIPLSTKSGVGAVLDFSGKPINANAPSLYDQYAAQRKQQQASAANYASNPTAYGPGY